MAATTTSDSRFKLSIGVLLLVTAIGAWFLSAVLYQGSSPAETSPKTLALPIATMASTFTGPGIGAVASFLLVWEVGMVAMMFPAMVPVMTFYSRLAISEEERPNVLRVIGVPLFLSGYLSLYILLGLSLFVAVYAAFQLGLVLPWLSSLSLVGLAAVLFITGMWQLPPLKEKSMSKCISPMVFFLTHTKKGFSGAFRMGAEHGTYCVSCCWLYMLLMLAVGAMSLVSMVLLSGLIIVEKTFVGGASWFKWLSAGIFFCLAALVVILPSSLKLL